VYRNDGPAYRIKEGQTRTVLLFEKIQGKERGEWPIKYRVSTINKTLSEAEITP